MPQAYIVNIATRLRTLGSKRLPERLDELLAGADKARGKIVKPAAVDDERGCPGGFTDLDDNLWQVAARD